MVQPSQALGSSLTGGAVMVTKQREALNLPVYGLSSSTILFGLLIRMEMFSEGYMLHETLSYRSHLSYILIEEDEYLTKK